MIRKPKKELLAATSHETGYVDGSRYALYDASPETIRRMVRLQKERDLGLEVLPAFLNAIDEDWGDAALGMMHEEGLDLRTYTVGFIDGVVAAESGEDIYVDPLLPDYAVN